MIRIAQPIIEDEERRAVLEALDSGQLAQGPRVAAFERAFEEYVGVPHAVAVSSGTAALHLALLAHGVGAGDEVIVPAFSFAATANTVLHCGARPVFVDVRDDDFCIDVSRIEAAITLKTKAIVPVHMYGQMCDVAGVREICSRRGLALIEDAAQAVGASAGETRAGTAGTGCFSLYATKNLQTGEGGFVTTADGAIADRVRLLRSQGERTRYVTEEAGYNYRMTEIAAALGMAQMPKLEARNEARRANAARLSALLGRQRAHRRRRRSCRVGDTCGTSTRCVCWRDGRRATGCRRRFASAGSRRRCSIRRRSTSSRCTGVSATGTCRCRWRSGWPARCCRCRCIQRCR